MEGASVGTVRNMPVPPAAGSDAHAMQMLQLAMAAEEQNSELRARLADKDVCLPPGKWEMETPPLCGCLE